MLSAAGRAEAGLELQRKRRGGRAPYSDASQRARLAGLPGIVWAAASGVCTVAVLLAGARRLIPPV